MAHGGVTRNSTLHILMADPAFDNKELFSSPVVPRYALSLSTSHIGNYSSPLPFFLILNEACHSI